jgi:hypothetical protein
MREQLDTLRLFNAKVARLEVSRFTKRYDDGTPGVIAHVHQLLDTKTTGSTVEFVAHITSELEDHDQDEIDAFLLTYRMFVQKNDRISIASLAKIYSEPWMPAAAAESFRDARAQVNEYLDSPISVRVGDAHICRRDLVDVLLYGGLAHSDHDKERLFRSWMADGGASGFLWAEFVVTLKDMLHYLRFFRDLNAAVIANCVP